MECNERRRLHLNWLVKVEYGSIERERARDRI
jgi:hypothetical protein